MLYFIYIYKSASSHNQSSFDPVLPKIPKPATESTTAENNKSPIQAFVTAATSHPNGHVPSAATGAASPKPAAAIVTPKSPVRAPSPAPAKAPSPVRPTVDQSASLIMDFAHQQQEPSDAMVVDSTDSAINQEDLSASVGPVESVDWTNAAEQSNDNAPQVLNNGEPQVTVLAHPPTTASTHEVATVQQEGIVSHSIFGGPNQQMLPIQQPVIRHEPEQEDEPYNKSYISANGSDGYDDASYSAANQSGVDEDSREVFKHQIKWIVGMIRNMKKKKDVYFFTSPVDPVALNIPQYFTIIKEPMDISTIEKKINENSYSAVQQIVDDFDLMFNNCFLFNGPVSPVTAAGKALQKWLHKELEKLPKTLDKLTEKKKRKSSIMLHSTPLVDSRPKRDVHAPPRDYSVSSDVKKTTKRLSPDLKFCAYIYRELIKKQYSYCNAPFLLPVDPDALGIPMYRSIIKRPMDLSTIKKKLDSADYFGAEDFEQDIRLMFNNCYTFNAPGSEVNLMGKQLESVFEAKWAERASFLEQQHYYGSAPGMSVSSSGVDYGVYHGIDETDDDEEDEEEKQHIQFIETQIELLNAQLRMLKEKRDKKKKRKSLGVQQVSSNNLYGVPSLSHYATPTPAPKQSRPRQQPRPSLSKSERKGSKKRSKPDASDDERIPDEITYEQKRELSENINMLTQEQLTTVFEIIKENADLNATGDEEIELDIDSLDKAVLWKLYKFVRKHTTQPKSSKKAKHSELTADMAQQAAMYESAVTSAVVAGATKADESSSSGSDSEDSGSNSD